MNGLEIFKYWMDHTNVYLNKIYGKSMPDLSSEEVELIQKSCLFYKADSDCNTKTVDPDEIDSTSVEMTEVSIDSNSSQAKNIANTSVRLSGTNLERRFVDSLISKGNIPEHSVRLEQVVGTGFKVTKQVERFDFSRNQSLVKVANSTKEQVLKFRELSQISKVDRTDEQIDDLDESINHIKKIFNSFPQTDHDENISASVKDNFYNAYLSNLESGVNEEEQLNLLNKINGLETNSVSYQQWEYNPETHSVSGKTFNGKNYSVKGLGVVIHIFNRRYKNTGKDGVLKRRDLVRSIGKDVAPKTDFIAKATTIATSNTTNKRGITAEAHRKQHNNISIADLKTFQTDKNGKEINKGLSNRGTNIRLVKKNFDREGGENSLEGKFASEYKQLVTEGQFTEDEHGANYDVPPGMKDRTLKAMVNNEIKLRKHESLTEFLKDDSVLSALENAFSEGNKKEWYAPYVTQRPFLDEQIIELKAAKKENRDVDFSVVGIGSPNFFKAVLGGMESKSRFEMMEKYQDLFPDADIFIKGVTRGKKGDLKFDKDIEGVGDLKIDTSKGGYFANAKSRTANQVSEEDLLSVTEYSNRKKADVIKIQPTFTALDEVFKSIIEFRTPSIKTVVNESGLYKRSLDYENASEEILKELTSELRNFDEPGGEGGGLKEGAKAFNVSLLRFARGQVIQMAHGITPFFYEDHHQKPLEDGGDNTIENMVLMREDAHRMAAHLAHNLTATSSGMKAVKFIVDQSDKLNIVPEDDGYKLAAPEGDDNNFVATRVSISRDEKSKKVKFTHEDIRDDPEGFRFNGEGNSATALSTLVVVASEAHVNYSEGLVGTLNHDVFPSAKKEYASYEKIKQYAQEYKEEKEKESLNQED